MTTQVPSRGYAPSFRQSVLLNDQDENPDFYEDDADNDIYEDGTIPPQRQYYPGINTCIVCQAKPPYSKNGRSYPTCGMRCAAVLQRMLSAQPLSGPGTQNEQTTSRRVATDDLAQSLNGLSLGRPTGHRRPQNDQRIKPAPCVVCTVKLCRDARFVTCGLSCAEKLCNNGSSNPNMCNYCHRRPKSSGSDQCSQKCIDNANIACLLCRSRPKFKAYHLCGKSCKQIATKSTPRILEAPLGHATYEFVVNKFKSSWKSGTPPAIKKVFKIIEGATFLQPYDRYKKSIGNEVFRYHGTKRVCQLGTSTTQLCSNTACAICSILRTSFKTSLANASGGFGPGIYSSSSSSKAYGYSSGVVLLTKVVLGNVHTVQSWGQVRSCPAGFNSVVFPNHTDPANETIVYSDDAIRPVFLITF